MQLRGAAIALCAALVALSSSKLQQVHAHSWLTQPVSRESKGVADIDGSMGCPTSTLGTSTPFRAGEAIDVRYWRNNHLGGFIRWSIVPRGSESKTTLDQSVFAYTCRESGAECVPQSVDWFAPDGAAANTISCGDQLTLPDWLPAGDYVLQWTMLGVGGKNGSRNAAEATFRSCADITLTTAGAKAAAPTCPAFTGGDRVTRLANNQQNDTCWYFHTNVIPTASTLYRGTDRDASDGYAFGVPAAVAACRNSSSSEVGSDSGVVVTTAPPTEAPATPAPTKKRRCNAKRAIRSRQRARI